MKSSLFDGLWISHPDFAELEPICVYHRESEPPKYDKSAHSENLKNRHVMFKKCFELNKIQGKYIFRMSADDYGKLYVNGKFAGQGPSAGYIEAYHYNEFDITDLLINGSNEIKVHVYYQGLINRVWISGDFRMGFIGDLISPDGKVILSTDESWEYSDIKNYTSMRTIGYETQYAEDFDSRIKASEYLPVALKKHDDITFDTKPTPAVEVYSVKPVSVEKIAGGVFYDFGREIVGGLKITAKGLSGDAVRILCGEECDESPEKTRFNMRCGCRYEEFWTLDNGENTLEQYDYKAFRYVTLMFPENTEIISVETVAKNFAFDENACTLETDDKVLSDVFELCKNGVRCGTQEVYVDCPTREKGQYAGDMTVTSGAQLWLTGDIYMLEKGILEQARSSMIDKGLMSVVSGSLMQEIADYSLQFPLLLLRHYAFTNDKEFLRSMLPYAEGMRDSFAVYARADGLLDGVSNKWNLVDWPANLRDGYDFPMTNPIGHGVHNVINAFYVGCVLNIEQIKDILGISHGGEGKKLAESFNRVFFNYEKGVYVDSEGSLHSSLHSNILAPFYGFEPNGYQDKIADFICSRGIVCGVYMSYFMLRSLCRLGRFEDAYKFITSTGENSWYNMVREGGTACFEAWGKDKKWNTSLCHPWASAPITVLIEDILSVSYDGTVGENHLPAYVGKLKMTIPTANGTVCITN